MHVKHFCWTSRLIHGINRNVKFAVILLLLAHFDRLYLFWCSMSEIYDTLKELFENVEPHNIIASVEDTNFHYCI